MLDRGDAICCGVSLTQCHTIVEIAKAGSISLNELADILTLDKSTVSRTVERGTPVDTRPAATA